MLKITFFKEKDFIKSFKIEGHADFAEHGYDIVCAAVSSLSDTTLQSLIYHIGEKSIEYSRKSGYVNAKLLKGLSDKQMHDSKVILMTFMIGIRGISEAYPNYVKLLTKEVQRNDV